MNYLVTFEVMEDDLSLISEDAIIIQIDPAHDVLTQIKAELTSYCGQAVVVAYERDDQDESAMLGYFC